MKSGITAVLLLAACGGARPAPTVTTKAPAATTSPEADAGVLVPCLPDGKDGAPCVEECNRGFAASCEVLAEKVATGAGVPRDLTRAVALHERACELREPAACVTAARMHGTGRGVVPDRRRQLELLVAACNLGDAAACTNAAYAYETGAGVSRDRGRARDLRQRACLGGDESSCEEEGDAGE